MDFRMQDSLFITNSWSLLKLMSIASVMPSYHLILYSPLLLPPSIFPSIRVFSSESTLCISSVQFSPSVVYDCLRPHGLQHARPITDSRNLLKLMSIELVMPSNQLILCHPLLLPSRYLNKAGNKN